MAKVRKNSAELANSKEANQVRGVSMRQIYKIQAGRQGPVTTLPLIGANASVEDAFKAMKAHRQSAFVVRLDGMRKIVGAESLSKAIKKRYAGTAQTEEPKLSDLLDEGAEPLGHSFIPEILTMASGGEPGQGHSKTRLRLLGEGVAAASVIAEYSQAAFWKEPQPTICYCKHCHRAVQKDAKCCNSPDLICVP